MVSYFPPPQSFFYFPFTRSFINRIKKINYSLVNIQFHARFKAFTVQWWRTWARCLLILALKSCSISKREDLSHLLQRVYYITMMGLFEKDMPYIVLFFLSFFLFVFVFSPEILVRFYQDICWLPLRRCIALGVGKRLFSEAGNERRVTNILYMMMYD